MSLRLDADGPEQDDTGRATQGDPRRDAHSDSDSAGRDIVADAAAAVGLGDFLSSLLDEGDNGVDLLGDGDNGVDLLGDGSLFSHDLTDLGPELFDWIAPGGQGAHGNVHGAAAAAAAQAALGGDDHGAAAAQAALGGDDHGADADAAWGGELGQGAHHKGGGHGGDGGELGSCPPVAGHAAAAAAADATRTGREEQVRF